MPIPRQSTEKPWERQAGESPQAWEAFQTYLNMGESRSTRKVAEQLGKSDAIINRWCSPKRWNWQERIRLYDNDNAKKAKRAAEKELQEAASRQAKIASQGLSVLISALKNINPDELSPKDIAAFAKVFGDMDIKNRQLLVETKQEDSAHGADGGGSLADTIIAAYAERRGGDED